LKTHGVKIQFLSRQTIKESQEVFRSYSYKVYEEDIRQESPDIGATSRERT